MTELMQLLYEYTESDLAPSYLPRGNTGKSAS